MTYSPGPAAPPRGTNTLAVVSLLLSVLAFCVLPIVGAVGGIVLGHMARRQIRETGEDGAGVATAGIVLGWVHLVLGVIALVVLAAAGVALFRGAVPVPFETPSSQTPGLGTPGFGTAGFEVSPYGG
ncbi:MAG TPA: DUF4190 domain-containing protein [Mycobacteriales bacterium]|jgi:hypothetical protein|nr:DUF4190 domain-containing protein [Mycobacteriales bacterium]